MPPHNPDQYFQAISLRQEKMTLPQISLLLGVPHSTVKSWFHNRHPHSIQKLLRIKMYSNWKKPVKKQHPWSKGLSADPQKDNYDPRLEYTKLPKKNPKLKGENNPAKRPEVRKKISERLKGRKVTNEQKRKQSITMKKKWANPEYQQKMSEAFSRKNISDANKRQLAKLHTSLKGRIFTKEWRKKISKSMKGNKNQEKNHSKETRKRISKAHKEMWGSSDFRSGLFLPEGRYESKEHYLMKLQAKESLESKGFNVNLEHPVITNDERFIVDVYGESANSTIIVECGDCPPKKLSTLREQFGNVIHYNYRTILVLEL